MRRMLFAALTLALAACNQTEAPPAPDDTLAEDGCPAQVTTTWRPAGGEEFAVSANTAGPSCAEATANLEVRAPNGDLALAFSAETQHVMGLSGVTETAAMQAALAGWAEQASERARTTADLPAWAEGAPQPGGEFPFYPQEGAERASYESLRAEGLPLFCVIQGMESEACHVLRGTELHLIGVQTFPG